MRNSIARPLRRAKRIEAHTQTIMPVLPADPFGDTPSMRFTSALTEEGLSRMSAIFDVLCKANPELGSVTFENPSGNGIHYSFPGRS